MNLILKGVFEFTLHKKRLKDGLLGMKIFAFSFLLAMSLIFIFPPEVVQADNLSLNDKILEVILKNPESIIESIEGYQAEMKSKKERKAKEMLQEIVSNPSEVIDSSSSKGAYNPDLLLIEFADFQCPYCAEVHKDLKRFVGKHKDRVALAYKHFPLSSIHSEALPSAQAAWAAGQQGKFWEYHDLLFKNQGKLGQNLYRVIAKQVGLDIAKFEQDRNSPEAIQAIEKDMQMGEVLGVQGTPFLMINKEMVSGSVDFRFLESKLSGLVNAK